MRDSHRPPMIHVLSIVLASCTMLTPGMIPYCYCMLLYVVDRVRYSVQVCVFVSLWTASCVHTHRGESVNNDSL